MAWSPASNLALTWFTWLFPLEFAASAVVPQHADHDREFSRIEVMVAVGVMTS